MDRGGTDRKGGGPCWSSLLRSSTTTLLLSRVGGVSVSCRESLSLERRLAFHVRNRPSLIPKVYNVCFRVLVGHISYTIMCFYHILSYLK